MGNKGIVSKHRSGRYHLCATNNETTVSFFVYMDVDIAHFIGCFVPIDRRMNDGMVQEIGPLLRLVIPSFGVLVKRLIKIVICPKSR